MADDDCDMVMNVNYSADMDIVRGRWKRAGPRPLSQHRVIYVGLIFVFQVGGDFLHNHRQLVFVISGFS